MSQEQPPTAGTTAGRGPLGRMLDRITSTSEELEARHLQAESRGRGATPVRHCTVGAPAVVSGTIRAVTLRPVGGVPALEAELYDGSGTLRLIWLGRRRITGVDPGRTLTVTGRVTHNEGNRTMFNPAYELHA